MRELIPEEIEVLEKLKDAWNAYIGLVNTKGVNTHMDEMEDFRKSIQGCQRLIFCRPTHEGLKDIWKEQNPMISMPFMGIPKKQ